MRVYPSEKVTRSEQMIADSKLKTEKITRIVALVVAGISTYFFIIKILFL